MTDKEVAEIIKVAKAEVEWEYPMEYAAAFDRAIEALEQGSCEDAISRSDILERCQLVIGQGSSDKNGYHMVSAETIMYVVKQLPSINPQPKTGHWIEVTNGRGGHECDVCHDYAPSFQNGDEYLSTFCPNCGVKMVEPQESEGNG